jgi:hypothetical protein
MAGVIADDLWAWSPHTPILGGGWIWITTDAPRRNPLPPGPSVVALTKGRALTGTGRRESRRNNLRH